MFNSCTTVEVKKCILEAFSKCDGTLRVVAMTVAFGMGLDCPNVRKIIH